MENPNRKPNEPVLVFESGLGMGGGNFETVFPYLPKGAGYFVYDRNGLGESEMDKSLQSDKDVVTRLHDLLTKLEIKPPYLLVRHSLGGPVIRLFDAKFPTEVSGLVFIDRFYVDGKRKRKRKRQRKGRVEKQDRLPGIVAENVVGYGARQKCAGRFKG